MARASINALCLFCGKELSGKQREEGFCSPVHALEYYQARPQDDDLGDVIVRDGADQESEQDSYEDALQRDMPDPASLEPEIFPAVLELNFDPPPAPASAPAAKLVSLAGARRDG